MEDIDSQITAWITQTYPVEMPYILSPEQRENLMKRNSIFQSLISEFPVSLGKETSRKEREKRNFENMPDSTLTYGEVDFVSIGEIFYTIDTRFKCLPTSGVFYDLGSGTGKGVAAAALLSSFDVCKGIELLEGLFNISLRIKSKYDEDFPSIQSENTDLFSSIPRLEFINGDFFKVDWSDASFIFANLSCFDYEIMRKIGEQQLKFGTIAVSSGKAIPGENWITLESIKKNMSWGEIIVYIQRYVNTEDIAMIYKKINDLVIDSDLID